VIGRALPTEANPQPTIYKMTVFAKNHVIAKSRFWVFLAKLKKIKRTHGEIIAVETTPQTGGVKARNYGILLRYNSRTGTHNLYKEFRDVTRIGAVQQLCKYTLFLHLFTPRHLFLSPPASCISPTLSITCPISSLHLPLHLFLHSPFISFPFTRPLSLFLSLAPSYLFLSLAPSYLFLSLAPSSLFLYPPFIT
jgi:Ribosomal proteins 50S-L18Ae/60S-L20/60S-L18A